MSAVTQTTLAVALTVACASALAGVVAPLCVPRPEPGVTLANFLRLREGMTPDEVEALFGRGPGVCFGGRGHCTCCWNEGACSASVSYQHTGRDAARVVSRTFRRPGEPDLTLPPKGGGPS